MNYTDPMPLDEIVSMEKLTNINSDISLNAGFVKLNTVEPCLGLPSGETTTDYTNYYFPIINKSVKYKDSRSFTGSDTLSISGRKIGYNNTSPIYEIDINGSIKALSATIPVLSASFLTGPHILNINNEFVFDSNVDFEKDTSFITLTANNVTVTNLKRFSAINITVNATEEIAGEILSGFTSLDFITINDILTADNITVSDNLSSISLSAENTNVNLLSSNYVSSTVYLTSSEIHTNNIHGKINIDPSSIFYYDGNNKLTHFKDIDLSFAVKPSDSYSTDDIVIRTLDNPWDQDSIESFTQNEVLKPFFKSIQSVFDYIKHFNLKGKNLNVYVYEDIENQYCTTTDSLTSKYYDINWLTTNQPELVNAGIKGGNFIWNKNTKEQYAGINCFELPNIDFLNININGVYEIGSFKNNPPAKEYVKQKPFNCSPHKLSFRSYFSANSAITFDKFKENGKKINVNDWIDVRTDFKTHARPVIFKNKKAELNIQNLCFEFASNAYDTTALSFYNGKNKIGNMTVALFGNTNYAYGAVSVFERAFLKIKGTNQIDPYFLESVENWESNKWSQIQGATGPDYYPGYGLAIVGQPLTDQRRTWVENFFYLDNSTIEIYDEDTNREIGRNSQLNSGIIFDGNFTSDCLYNFQKSSFLFSLNYLFKNENFSIKNLASDFYNGGLYRHVFELYDKGDFHNIYFKGSFNIYSPHNLGLTPWTVKVEEDLSRTLEYDSNLSMNFVTPNDENYIFNNKNKSIDLSNMVNSIGYKNQINSWKNNNSNSILYRYVSDSSITLYDHSYYKINTPFDYYNLSYILNYYSYDQIYYKPVTLPDPSSTCTPTCTPTSTPSPTCTPTITRTPDQTPTPTVTCTSTNTPTITQSISVSMSQTPTLSPSNSLTPSQTPSLSISPTQSPSLSVTPTYTPTNTKTPTNTTTVTPTSTPDKSPTPTPSVTPTFTPSISITPSNTPTISISPTNTPTNTQTPTKTLSPTVTPTYTPTKTRPVAYMTIEVVSDYKGELEIDFTPTSKTSILRLAKIPKQLTRDVIWDGVLPLKLTINVKAKISSSNPTKPTINIKNVRTYDTVTVNVLSSGSVYGAGGIGGAGAIGINRTKTPPSMGGDAIQSTSNFTLYNYGLIASGGGGGGNGAGYIYVDTNTATSNPCAGCPTPAVFFFASRPRCGGGWTYPHPTPCGGGHQIRSKINSTYACDCFCGSCTYFPNCGQIWQVFDTCYTDTAAAGEDGGEGEDGFNKNLDPKAVLKLKYSQGGKGGTIGKKGEPGTSGYQGGNTNWGSYPTKSTIPLYEDGAEAGNAIDGLSYIINSTSYNLGRIVGNVI